MAGPAPPPDSSPATLMTYDAADGYVLLYDPLRNDASSSSLANATWKFQAGKWSHLSVTGGALVTGPAGIAYDSTDGYVLAVGDRNFHCGEYDYDVCESYWTYGYRAGTWTNHTSGIQPLPTWWHSASSDGGFPIADDPALSHLILYEGPGLMPYPNESGTWEYAAGIWTYLTQKLSASPESVSGSALGYDSAVGGLLLFGGDGSGTSSPTDSNTTWLLSSSTWKNLSSSFKLSPPGLEDVSMCWDASQSELLLFGGTTYSSASTFPLPPNAGAFVSDQTWVLSNTSFLSTPTIRSSVSPADAGATIGFAAQFTGGLAPYSYSWSFGDGEVSTLAGPTHVYAGLGPYTVFVRVNDSSQQSTNASITLRVVLGLTVDPTILPNPTEVGVPVGFAAHTRSGASVVQVEWAFGDGSPVGSFASHTYTRAGQYEVELWANDTGGGRVNASLPLTVFASLGPLQINASTSYPIQGELVNYSVSVMGGVGPYRVAWDFGDGSTAGNLTEVEHVYSSTGPYEVLARVTDALGVIGSAYLNITVLQLPAPRATLQVSSSSVVVGGLLELTTNVSGGVAPFSFVYVGLPPGCGSQDIAAFSCFPAETGTFEVSVIVTGANGQRGTANATLEVLGARSTPPPAGPAMPSPAGFPFGEALGIAAAVSVGVAAAVYLVRRLTR